MTETTGVTGRHPQEVRGQRNQAATVGGHSLGPVNQDPTSPWVQKQDPNTENTPINSRKAKATDQLLSPQLENLATLPEQGTGKPQALPLTGTQSPSEDEIFIDSSENEKASVSQPIPTNSTIASPLPGGAEFHELIDKELKTTFSANSVTFDACTPEQQVYILQYMQSMIADGNKPEFAGQIGASMVILYNSEIEQYMPKLVKRLDAINTITNSDHISKRKQCKRCLTEIMKKHGADYDIAGTWLSAQQGNSWSNSSKAIKYFLLKQRSNPDEIPTRYYIQQEYYNGVKNAIRNFERSYNCLKNPSVLGKRYDDSCYGKSISFYKAFTAIALKKSSIPYVSSENHICVVKRGDKLEEMEKHYPSETWKRTKLTNGDINISPNVLGGIADSTSLGVAASAFSGPGFVSRIFEVPFSRIHAVYFVSSELCCDESSSLKNNYAKELEVICDFSCLPSKIPDPLVDITK